MAVVSLHSNRNSTMDLIYKSFYNRLTDWEGTMAKKPAYLWGFWGFVPELTLEKVKNSVAHDPCPDGVQTNALENWGRSGRIN